MNLSPAFRTKITAWNPGHSNEYALTISILVVSSIASDAALRVPNIPGESTTTRVLFLFPNVENARREIRFS